MAVYRMHPLVPDDYPPAVGRRRLAAARRPPCASLSGQGALETMRARSRCPTSSTRSARCIRASSACTTSPGSSRSSCAPTASSWTWPPLDILRSRELGVPRYNEFRRLLHLHAGHGLRRRSPTTRVWAEELREVYDGDIEKRRPHAGHVRRAPAQGLRLQRHRLPDLRAHGVPPAQQRPLLHRRLHRRGLHQGRASTGSTTTPWSPSCSATTPSCEKRRPA